MADKVTSALDSPKRNLAPLLDLAALVVALLLFSGLNEARLYWRSRNWPIVEAVLVEKRSAYRSWSYAIEIHRELSTPKRILFRRDDPFLFVGHTYKTHYLDGEAPVINSYWTLVKLATAAYLLWLVIMTKTWGWAARLGRWRAKYGVQGLAR